MAGTHCVFSPGIRFCSCCSWFFSAVRPLESVLFIELNFVEFIFYTWWNWIVDQLLLPFYEQIEWVLRPIKIIILLHKQNYRNGIYHFDCLMLIKHSIHFQTNLNEPLLKQSNFVDIGRENLYSHHGASIILYHKGSAVTNIETAKLIFQGGGEQSQHKSRYLIAVWPSFHCHIIFYWILQWKYSRRAGVKKT